MWTHEAEEPGGRTAVERRLFAPGVELPPLAQFAGRGHSRIAPRCSESVPRRHGRRRGRPALYFRRPTRIEQRFRHRVKTPLPAGCFGYNGETAGRSGGFSCRSHVATTRKRAMLSRSGWVAIAVCFSLGVGRFRRPLGQPCGRPKRPRCRPRDGVELSRHLLPEPTRPRPGAGQASDAGRPAARREGHAGDVLVACGAAARGRPGPETAFVRRGDRRPARPRGRARGKRLPTARRASSTPRSSTATISLAMSAQDMEAVRGFLVGKNDDGELNLNKLCLVGVGMGATVAVNWAAQDWSAPPLLVGKQGQDVKALVLVSPQWKYRGIMLQQALRLADLKKGAAWMLIYGEQDPDQTADARRIYRQLERFHPAPESAQGAAAKPGGSAASVGTRGKRVDEPDGRSDRGQYRQLSDDPRGEPGSAVEQTAKSTELAATRQAGAVSRSAGGNSAAAVRRGADSSNGFGSNGRAPCRQGRRRPLDRHHACCRRQSRRQSAMRPSGICSSTPIGSSSGLASTSRLRR